MADRKGSALVAASSAVALYLYGWIGAVPHKVPFSSFFREKLTADRDLYVRTNGSDSNDGSANDAAHAFLTRQAAADYILGHFDLNGFDVTVHCAAGAYTGTCTVSSPWVGSGTVTFIGDETTPANVTVTTASADCFRAEGDVKLIVKGFKLSTTTTGSELAAYDGGRIVFNNVSFGVCAAYQIDAQHNGYIECISGTYSISGGALMHVLFQTGGEVHIHDTVVNGGGGAYAFGIAFVYGAWSGSKLFAGTMTFTSCGSFTGMRFLVVNAASISVLTGSLTYFPGNVAGSIGVGASYDAIYGGAMSLTGSATYDPASLADGAGATTTVTVTGAALGDFAMASFSNALQGITVTAWVSAADTVSVRFQNESGGVLDLASGTLRAGVIKA
jgi:hypothetical protein